MDITEEYRISISPCQGSPSRITDQNMDDRTIEFQNQWNTMENIGWDQLCYGRFVTSWTTTQFL
eukprot:4073782-Ditylum_brightwellii.AAC.1